MDFLRVWFIIVSMGPNFNEKLPPADRRTFSILLTNRAENVFYEQLSLGNSLRFDPQ